MNDIAGLIYVEMLHKQHGGSGRLHRQGTLLVEVE